MLCLKKNQSGMSELFDLIIYDIHISGGNSNFTFD